MFTRVLLFHPNNALLGQLDRIISREELAYTIRARTIRALTLFGEGVYQHPAQKYVQLNDTLPVPEPRPQNAVQ